MWRAALLTAGCLSLSHAGLPLPPYIKPCAKNDPNINECAVKHGNDAIPELIKGDRALKIPVLDPFEIKEVRITDDGSRPAGISITLRNAKVYGIKDSQLKKATIDLDAKHNSFEVLTRQVQIIGEYEVAGRILLLPINGKGDANLTIDNMYVTYHEYWHLTPRNGERYLIRDNVTVTSEPPTNFHIKITNLFNGNRLLGDQMNIFLNENWKDAYNEMSPAVFKVMSEVIYSVVVRISSVVPFDNIFPDNISS